MLIRHISPMENKMKRKPITDPRVIKNIILKISRILNNDKKIFPLKSSLFCFCFENFLANFFFMPSTVQLREIHQCQRVDQKKGERVKMTDAAKVKEEKVGGDDGWGAVRTQRDWSQTTASGGEYTLVDVVGV